MKRWLVLVLALGALALALFRFAGPATRRADGPPMEQIDEASRQELREVLRESREP